MSADVSDVLFDANEIRDAVASLAGKVLTWLEGNAIPGNPPVLVEILEGATPFADAIQSELGKAGVGVDRDALGLASYGDATRSSGQVDVTSPLAGSVAGRTVVLADDIIDTGRTLKAARIQIHSQAPANILTCVLLDKGKAHPALYAALDPLFTALPCPDSFVVGFGMDHAGKYRELPYIAATEEGEQYPDRR